MGAIWRQLLGIALGGACVFSTSCATAQITPDRTLPNNSSVTINGSTFNITGGTQAGRNLFHSFQQFSVPTGGTASFINGADIQNIISRVTGGSASNIDGLITASGTANLFFLNPNGIVFGKNASLNIGGSFVATTANAIQFGNLGTFSATVPNNPALLTINPSALFYNQIAAGASIQNSSTSPAGVAPTGLSSSGLRVPDGKSLLLVGGDITMDGGRLRAYGGRVELGGLASSGTVGLGVNGNNFSLSFPNNVTRSDVSLLNGANVNVSSGGGGSITANANNLNITGGSGLTAGIAQGLGSVGSQAGDITLNATGDIKIDGSSLISNNVGAVNNTQNNLTKGNGGNIEINTSQLELTNNAQIQAVTFGQGNAGNVTINATNSVSFAGSGSDIFSTVGFANNSQNNFAIGKGGDIQITTDQLSLTNGAQLQASTFGQGNAGNVNINATKTVSLDGNGTSVIGGVGSVNDTQNNLAIGNGGNIEITTDQLSLTNGAQLRASTDGQGNAGNVTINATKTVSLDGSQTAILSNVGSLNNIQNNIVKGNGGNIQITTDQLSLTNGASLTASTLGQGNAGNVIINAAKNVSLDNKAAIFNTVGAVNNNQNNLAIGNGGNIQITTEQLSLSNNAQLVASTFGQGNAGNVNINATKSVSLDGNGTGVISGVGSVNDTQNNLAIGNGGNIQITTDQLSLSNGALVDADTLGQGNAGNVIINATKNVSFSDKGGVISTVGAINDNQNNLAKGNGGNIQITTEQLLLSNDSQLDVTTYGQGNAGNVIINATKNVSLSDNGTSFLSIAGDPGLTPQQNSIAQGEGGNIKITTGELSLSNGAQLNASTFGQSNAGNLEISASSIRLDHGLITSQTRAGNGGNITLTPNDLLLLQHDSQISTTAGNAQLPGNGGQITINAPSGFVVAVRNENNDITANAFNGSGGVIKINAQGIYNFNQLSLQDLENLLGTNDPTKLDPQQLPTNDITAISQTNPNLSGTVQINTPDIDPTRGLVTLPTVSENTPKLVSSSCAAFNETAGGSSFTVTGRGGLPPSPDEPLTSDVVWSDTRLPNTTTQHKHKTHEAKPKPQPIAIVPAKLMRS